MSIASWTGFVNMEGTGTTVYKPKKANSTYGLHFITRTPLAPNTKVIACPASLVITKETAIRGLQGLGVNEAELKRLNERQLVAGYVTAHFAVGLENLREGSSAATHLRHEMYISTLPTNQELLTPFQWTATELSLVEGLNLGHAANSRRELWHREWEELERILKGVVLDGALNWLTLRQGTTTSSQTPTSPPERFHHHYSTRLSSTTPINPSHLDTKSSSENENEQSSVPANEVTPKSYPVLDSRFGHVEPPTESSGHLDLGAFDRVDPGPEASAERSVGLVLRSETEAGEQVFNNYGPKGNEELILGYGFSLPENPDDTLALKLGIPEHTLTPYVREALSRLRSDTQTPPPRSNMGPQSVEEEEELEMDVTGLLLEMVQTKLERLNELLERNEGIVERAEVRTEVWDMVQDYVQGQMDILAACNAGLERRMDALAEGAGEGE
ncbi:hypothetical protein QFC20_006951 [Naganishia adeliensis]|uniref:Uncharacterized protein n=1 Tax=Naganishia adeliensis TaxID=92952 RepID=A0ACC2V4X3_9TREE|nr:hypothetical protein QFC20_006951 [Naganishia adeliensis]